jgi:hypothetical protein
MRSQLSVLALSRLALSIPLLPVLTGELLTVFKSVAAKLTSSATVPDTDWAKRLQSNREQLMALDKAQEVGIFTKEMKDAEMQMLLNNRQLIMVRPVLHY